MSDYGYRVPDGEADITEMACQLVFYPDIPEYRTALFTALERFAAWTSWERDDDHKGKDAADSWKIANELTWECWRMACLEQLQSDVSAILAHLQATVPCCGDIITYGDSTTYVTTIIPGNGDDPTVYGETAVSDWDEWKEYLCHNANLWLDELIAQSNSIETVLDVGGLSVGLVAYALAAVALFVVGGFISGPIVVAVTAGIIAGYTANMFSDAADELEDSRDDIVCAIINGRSLSGAIESAVSSNVAWNIFYNQIDYVSAVAILYEGGDGETFLEDETDDTCSCNPQVGEYWDEFEFDGDGEEFIGRHNGAYTEVDGNPVGAWRAYDNDTDTAGEVRISIGFLATKHGKTSTAGDYIDIHRVEFDVKSQYDDADSMSLYVDHAGTTSTFPAGNQPTWTRRVHVFEPPLRNTDNVDTYAIRFVALGALGSWQYVDNVVIDYDAVGWT